MDEDLKKYVTVHVLPHIEVVESLAGTVMPENPHELIAYITRLRGYCVFLNKIATEMQTLYRQAEYTYKPVKTKDQTEFDREIMLKSLVADYEAWKDRINGLIRILEGHSSLAQSILSFEKSAMGHLGAGG